MRMVCAWFLHSLCIGSASPFLPLWPHPQSHTIKGTMGILTTSGMIANISQIPTLAGFGGIGDFR